MAGELEAALSRRSPRSIGEVIALMQAIDDAVPVVDGVGWFTKLYLAVTESVREAADTREFAEERFLRWLDVSFANLYFRALRHHMLGTGPVPSAWKPLLDARDRTDIAPLQFALAGMNAHINRDLPVALGEAWAGTRTEPGVAQYADFTAVNALLEATEERVRQWFATGFVTHLDREFGDLDSVTAMWSVARAREAAWVNAETLWALRPVPPLREQYLATLDRMVGFAGRGLLRPLPV